MSCGSPLRELLPAWVAGELDPARSAEVERHLEDCPDCRELADHLRGIRDAVAPLKELTPPEELSAAMVGTACERWRRLLFEALDGGVEDDELAPLLDHLETCPACAAVWSAFAATRDTLASIQPPTRLVERCRRIPWAARRRRIPGVRTAAAAAYALAVTVSLLLGNPVTLARQQMRTAAQRVETRVKEVTDDGRGELRMMVWRIWRLGEETATAIHRIFNSEPPRHTDRNGEAT